jgi:hypothetical protein
MNDAMAFAKAIGGEMSAGSVVATINGKKQYIYRDGEFTAIGRKMYNEWQSKPQPQTQIKLKHRSA